jgi:DNA repair photolyase
MKRYTGHKEEWGEFVDVKINAPSLLQREIERKKAARIWISGTCDPYQPLEKKYELTRKCLETLSKHAWPVIIQTKSSLVNRDVDLLRKISGVEVGLTITTADERVRKMFEPNASSIKERIETLLSLRSAGIRTFAMIAPLLPNAEGLAEQLSGNVDYVLVDKMNYHYADWVYKKFKLEYAMTSSFSDLKKKELANGFEKNNLPYRLLF